MKQFYLLPLSLILMIQGFGNDPLLQENEAENFTGSVILAPDEASLELEQAQKIVSVNAEKFHFRDPISDNENDDSNEDDDSDDSDHEENDVSFEYDDEYNDTFISGEDPLSPVDAPAMPKSQKVVPAPAKEGASYGITDIPPPATPESKPAMPTPRKEESTYRAPNAPAQGKPQSAALKRPSQQVKPAEATTPQQSQQQPTTRRPSAQRRQQPTQAQSEQASAAETTQQSPSTRQAPARRRQQPARAQSEQASAADTAQQFPSTRQAPARRRQQPARAQSEQASAASKAEQKPASPRQPSVQRSQQPQVSKNTQRSSNSRQSSRSVETAEAEDDVMQSPARTTPRQRAYYQSSPRNTREQGRLQAQNNGPNMGTPYTQKINQSSMEPSGPKETSPSKLPQAINMPARPVVQDGWNLWILGEALLWQAVQENMEYIYKGHNGNNNLRVRDIKKPHFDWDWGWRFGAGYNIPRDGWDLSLIWTHIENHAQGTTHRGDELLFKIWSVAAHVGDVFNPKEANAHWNVHLDQVDLDLGRQFYVGRYLTLRPNAGMRSSWIFQDYDVDFEGINGKQKSHMTNKFWGMGFFAGLDSDWMLGRGFSLFGDAGFAVLLGYFDVDQHGTFNGSTISKISKSFRTGRPIFDLDLGLKWSKKIYSDRFAIGFKVGYEYHLYFNQNQYLLSSGNDNFELFNPVNGDLTYQGVTFSGQFDF